MIPYPAYKSTNLPWLPKIPEHWEVYKIRDLFIERNTKVSDKDYAPLSVSKGGIVPQIETVAKTDNGENRKLVKKGDFVINSRSDRKGSSGVSSFDGSVSLINLVLKPRNSNNDKFLHYLLRSIPFVEEFYRNGHGIVADLWTTRYSEMKTISIPFPSDTEQEQIVRYLDSMTAKINKLIRAKKKQIALLQEQRQAIINNAVTRGLDPNVEMKDSGIDWIGEIPKHWTIQRLGHFSSLQNGISAPAEYFGSGFPFIGYGDVYNNYEIPSTISGRAKSSNEEQKRYSVQEGDIFFTRTSETMEEIAFSSVCRKTIPHATFSGFLIRVRPHKRVISTLFAKYYFRNMKLRNYFVKEMNLVTRASLSQQLLRNLPVILPPIEEQEEIAQKIEAENDCFSLTINKFEHEITLFDEYKKSLISSIITGQADVRNIPVEDVIPDDLIPEDDSPSEIEDEPTTESEE